MEAELVIVNKEGKAEKMDIIIEPTDEINNSGQYKL